MAVVTVLLRLYQGQTIKPSSAPTVVHGRHWRAWEWSFPNRKKYWNPYDYDGKNDNDTYELYDSGLKVMYDRFAESMLDGKEIPITFEDAANWTAAGILSAESVEKGGMPVEVPTFTE